MLLNFLQLSRRTVMFPLPTNSTYQHISNIHNITGATSAIFLLGGAVPATAGCISIVLEVITCYHHGWTHEFSCKLLSDRWSKQWDKMVWSNPRCEWRAHKIWQSESTVQVWPHIVTKKIRKKIKRTDLNILVKMNRTHWSSHGKTMTNPLRHRFSRRFSWIRDVPIYGMLYPVISYSSAILGGSSHLVFVGSKPSYKCYKWQR